MSIRMLYQTATLWTGATISNGLGAVLGALAVATFVVTMARAGELGRRSLDEGQLALSLCLER